MPHIHSITYRPPDIEQRPEDRYTRVPLERGTLVADHGIKGDTKGRAGERELNVMLAETVEQLRVAGFRTGPGELGEQVVIADLRPEALAPGSRLRLGETAVIEITIPRTGCSRFAHIQGHPIQAASGKMGVMARVVCGGDIAVGAEVTPLGPAE